ncbi:DNA-formamidopyrimidine glycosylase family protein [Pedobacter sp.]|uniref:DNA-formamidopyrimidine glycosylase family protein n=1 Tax=Pedobacter sp. TaxID=1411316 RepID=UPI003D7FCD5B
MPELPDLQLFSRNLHQKLAGLQLNEIDVPVSGKLNVPKSTLEKAIVGHTLKSVKRDGKTLHFIFDNGHTLQLHLMLNGELVLGEETPKHTIISFRFSDGSKVSLTDFRKMANATLDPEPSNAPDALEVDAEFFEALLGTKKTAIKNILLDQQLIRGIGNAYADEILWQARISPFSKADQIPKAKIKELSKAVTTVLQDAEKQLIKSHPDIISGEIRDFLKIHGAKIKESPTGAPVLMKKTGSRKTYYTDEQTLFE